MTSVKWYQIKIIFDCSFFITLYLYTAVCLNNTLQLYFIATILIFLSLLAFVFVAHSICFAHKADENEEEKKLNIEEDDEFIYAIRTSFISPTELLLS